MPSSNHKSKPPSEKDEIVPMQRSPSIVNASEQAVRAAVNMERSDSILILSDEDETSLSDSNLQQSNHGDDKEEEEEAAIEAMLSSSERQTQIIHAHHVSSVASKHSYRYSMTSGDLGEVSRFLTLESDSDQEACSSEPPIPPRQPLFQHEKTPSETADEPMSDALEILESCGAMPLSLSELATLYRRFEHSSDKEIATALSQARTQSRHGGNQQQSLNNDHLLNEKDQAMILHSVFVTFCSPPPSLENITRILKLETLQDYTSDVPLPKDALISVSGAPKESIVSLLTHEPRTHLLQLPIAFQLAFFRILVRLLTNETDAEYNQECLFTCDWIQEEEKVQSFAEHVPPEDEMKAEIQKKRAEIIQMRKSLLDGNSHVARRPNSLYTVVRFQSGTAWKEHAVTSLLNLFALLLGQDELETVLAPVSRLIGLCGSAGVQVKELRGMLALAGRPFPDRPQAPIREPGLDRLLMIRAVATAAEGASRSSLLVGKASPRYFFNFGLGHGLARTFQSLSNWPFRNDFGMAVWFRAESLDFTNNARHLPKLFSARTHDGGGIEVSLVPLTKKAKSDTTATVIAVTVYDSQAHGKEASEVQQVKLERCILLPHVWYHVAVRHTRSRLKGVFSMSSRQQVSIMLDGKMMLTETLKFPKISMAESGGESPSLLRSTLRRQTGRPGGSTMTIQCGANFDGQTGAFYVFSDNVSDSTLRSLYEISGGTDGVIKRKSLTQEDASWDERRSSIAVRSHALSVEITKADAEEIVLSGHDSMVGSRSDSNNNGGTAVTVADMGDDGQEDGELPVELSKGSFGSKLFLVWDPRREEDQVALDLHSGAHVKIDVDKVQAWHVDGAKSVISSIGGVQALIPVCQALLAGDIERYWPFLGNENVKDNNTCKEKAREKIYIIVPCLLSLLTAFIREHSENAREMLRFGGIDILEQLLVSNKAQSASFGGSKCKETVTSVLTVDPALSRYLVSSLLEIRSACSHYTGLETIVFSRLLFNFQLWFCNPSQAYGVALYGTLLPVLSSLSKTTPRKVRDCVGVRPIIEQLREYTNTDETEGREAFTELFDRSRWSGLNGRDNLTIRERRHAVDVLLSMASSLLASGTLPGQLQPMLNYISYNVDLEWEQASQNIKEEGGSFTRTGTRLECYFTMVKASTLLLCLLQVRPEVPGLLDSLSKCCGGEVGAASWLLCCLVNTYDDDLRSIGLRCFSAYLDQVAPGDDAMLTMSSDHFASVSKHSVEGSGHLLPFASSHILSSTRLTNTISSVGKGLAAIGNSAALSQILPASKVSVKVVYKLLWHLLKCHRERSEKSTHAALLQVILEEGELMHSSISCIDEFVVKDDTLHCGYCISMKLADTSALSLGSYSDETLRHTPAIGTILLLLRFFPTKWREQWLRVFYDVSQASRSNVETLLMCSQWQPPLFHLVSDVVEELATKCSRSTSSGNGDLDNQSTTSSSFDLCFQLYASVLGHCFRHGGEQALQMLEQAASLQRTCVNGQEVLILILGHLLADLNKFGTIETPIAPAVDGSGERNRFQMVTSAIMSNTKEGFDTTSAVKQWRCLRHLTAVTAAVVTKSGFGVADLFDYRNQHASSLDDLSGGLYGIRLSDSGIAGVTAEEYASLLSQSSLPKRDQRDQRERDLYRQACVSLSAQVLSLLDSFIFPDSLDASLPASQLHGLALVRSSEPRMGVSQGPVLASLVRLSLVLMCHLEPSSVKFLQCCSRLRCLLHWMLELVRESVSLAGYSTAFNELTAPLDRLLLAIVLQCHRSLARCSSVIAELEGSHYSVYFPSEEVKKKNYKRTLRAALEIREIVLAAFRGRIEVLRASLTPKAFGTLQAGLETNPTGSKEAVIRAFLSNDWVANFQDVDLHGSIAIPAQLTENQDAGNAAPSKDGIKAIEALAAESNAIIADFNRTLDIQFGAYCEYQRQWAETDAVRDLEYEGDSVVQRLSQHHRLDLSESAKQLVVRADAAASRLSLVEHNIIELWTPEKHWKLAEHTDRMTRRILLVRNREFNDHHDASYELMLNQERAKAVKDREERERKKQEEELAELMRRNPSAYVPYDGDRDIDDEMIDEGDDQDLSEKSSARNDKLAGTGSSESRLTANDRDAPELKESASHTIEDADNVTSGEEKPTELIGSLDIDAWAKAFIWSGAESVVARFDKVSIVSLQTITEGRLLLTTHGLYFNQTGKVISVMTKQPTEEADHSGPSSRRWRLSRLTEVHGRRFMLRAQALELFFSDSHELFVNFEGGTRERDRFYAKLRNSCKVPLLWSPKSLNPRTVFKRSQLTQLWRKRKLSNFQYLMQLNKMAGRTFNDITQYPVFPWVLSDYTSEEIDLNDIQVYRDLSKPIGALNPDRLSQLIERYKELESFGFSENERFLYGSHYSSPGVVLHYMLRQEPFTTMAIELQSGRFDCPDRLFFDVAGCWNSCMTSTSDVKELISEFFTCPEIFLNTNHFPLGSTQVGRPIDNVGLPPWAKGSAYEFVRLHRLALESDIVSQNLHKWIDLIFGYKQRGLEAETAHNVFHYLSYEGAVDLDQITDEVDRVAAESHIQNFGQTPCQLLVKKPHPMRLSAVDTWQPLIYDMSVPRNLRCHKPVHQFGGKQNGIARGAVLSIHVMSESVLVVYADLSMGSYKWNPNRRGKHPFSFKKDKHRYVARHELSASRASIKRSSALPQSMGSSGSRYAVGSWSFGLTLGGQTKENLRRKEAMAPSRLAPSSDTISTVETSSMLISCGYWDDTVKVHSVDGSKLLCSVTGGHRGPIRCLAIGADGGLMITGGEDGTCRVWVIDHPDMAVALSDGYVQTALGASNDREQLLSCCHVLWGHETPVMCVALSSDLDVAVSGSLGGAICVHTVRRGHFIRSIRLHLAVRSIVLDTHGVFVAHTEDDFLHVYTINGVSLCSTDAKEHLHDMKVTSEGQILVTGGDKGHVVVRSVHDLAILSMLDLSQYGPIHCISLTPTELNPIPQFLFIGSDDGLVTVVDRDPHAISEHFESEYVSFKL